MSETEIRRLHGLDTLRSAAIILVFMYHYRVFVSHEPTFGWASTVGWVGVDLFFVLSGYLIGNQIFAGIAAGRQLSIGSFYARRFLRTLPDYYVVLALYFLFPAVMGGKTPPPLWRFLTFTQNWGLVPGTAFSHAWSLCIEEQFYLLFPLLVLGMLRVGGPIRRAWVLLGLVIACAVVLRSLFWFQEGRDDFGGSYYTDVYYSSLCRFDEFLPGIAVAMLKNFHGALWQRLMRRGNIILTLGAVLVTAFLWLNFNYYDIEGYGYGFFMSAFGYSLQAVGFAVLVLAALSPSSLLYRLRIPGAAQLAAWSYAIYLSHKAIAVIVYKSLEKSGLPQALTLLIVVAACMLGGWLLYRLVETPFMRIRSRYFPGSFSGGASEPAVRLLAQAAR